MNFSNKIVLITGAAGSIGSALARTIAKKNPKLLVILDQDETGIFDIYEEIKGICKTDYEIATIRDKEKLDYVFAKHKPNIVYHAAAYKHVVLMEKCVTEAIKTNVHGTENLITCSNENKVEKFIFISSDKAVNPTSIMGRTKLAGETMCREQKGKTKYIIVRFGNVMPSRGSVVPIFTKQIAEGKDLTVTSKSMKRYFLGIYEAVNLVIEATELGKGGEIFVLDMGEPLYISDLAKTMIKISGKDLSIKYSHPHKGEKFSEELMKKEEKKRAIKKGKLFIIR